MIFISLLVFLKPTNLTRMIIPRLEGVPLRFLVERPSVSEEGRLNQRGSLKSRISVICISTKILYLGFILRQRCSPQPLLHYPGHFSAGLPMDNWTHTPFSVCFCHLLHWKLHTRRISVLRFSTLLTQAHPTPSLTLPLL